MVHVTGDPGFPAWTNSVDASLAAKLDTTVASSTYLLALSVKSFGAKGDSNGTTGNGTDDTAAISAAFTAAATAGRATVFFPPGVYRTTALVQSSGSNVTIRGGGIGASVIYLDHDGFGVFVGTGSLNSDLFDGNGASTTTSTGAQISNVAVRDLSIRGRGYTTKPAASFAVALTVRYADQFTLDGIEVSGGGTYGVFVHDRCTNGNITDVWSHHHEADGIHVDRSSHIAITGCHVHDTGDDGIGVTGDGGVCSTEITVAGNHVSTTGSRGIFFGGVQTSTITGNIVQKTFVEGIMVAADLYFARCDDIAIRDNVLNNVGTQTYPNARGQGRGTGIFVRATSESLCCNNITITGNTMDVIKNCFIVIGQAAVNGISLVSIADNMLGWISGIGALGAASGVNGGTQIDWAIHPGIYINGARDVHISGNQIKLAADEAIRIEDTGTNFGAMNVTNNVCLDPNQSGAAGAKAGISIRRGVATYLGNTVIDGGAKLTTAIEVLTPATSPIPAAGGPAMNQLGGRLLTVTAV